ncbi:MAG: metal ABC transporter ATP-binding protein [Clostridiaceae bacterium]
MITIENLSFSYSGIEPYLLKDVNIKIIPGSYAAIMGDNGSAKTTLVKLILRLLKPVAGIVELETKKIGYLPQNSKNINSQVPITVSEFMNCHAKVIRLKDKNSVDSALKSLDMLDKKNRLISDLSGGQLQKILIARALLGKPELLILDEPSTGLDANSHDEIYSILKRLNIEEGVTIVSVEHNLHAAFKNSTEILSIENGTVKSSPVPENSPGRKGVRNVRI